jgi:hypothetical protein
MISTGMVSGYISEAMGYERFFIMVMIASALPLIALWFAPNYENDEKLDTLPVDTLRAPVETHPLHGG